MPRRDNVSIDDFSLCDSASPQVHCANFITNSDPSCDADLGSPVICSGDGMEISGFVITDGCEDTRIFFHSVVKFRDWILRITKDNFVDDSTARFVVNVASYEPPSMSPRYRCAGIVISSRHVIAPASCAQVEYPLRIAIQHAFGVGLANANTEHVFIHPRYVAGVIGINNIAVIRIVGMFDSELIPPRSLGGLIGNSTCNLHGWSGPLGNNLRRQVGVFAPQFCYGSLPQAFCSTFNTHNQMECTSTWGAPIICNVDGRIDGFVITGNLYCDQVWGRHMLSYHSVEEFRDWIEYVSGAKTISFTLILSVISVGLRYLF